MEDLLLKQSDINEEMMEHMKTIDGETEETKGFENKLQDVNTEL